MKIIRLISLVFLVSLIILIFLFTLRVKNSKEETALYNYAGSLLGQTFRGLPKPKLPVDKPYFGISVDIDNDGKKETVFYTIEAMTKPPHRAYIVKDNKIVFESGSKPSVQIEEKEDHNGFYLSEYTTEEMGNRIVNARKETIYIPKDGKYVPSEEGINPDVHCPLVYTSTIQELPYIPENIKTNEYVMGLLKKGCLLYVESFSQDLDSDKTDEIFLITSKVSCGTASCKTRQLAIIDGTEQIFSKEGYGLYFQKTAKSDEFETVEQYRTEDDPPCCSDKVTVTKYVYSNGAIIKLSDAIQVNITSSASFLKNEQVSKIVITNKLMLYDTQFVDITGDAKEDIIATFVKEGCADCVEQRILILSNDNIVFDVIRDFPTLKIKSGENSFTVQSSIYLSNDYTCCASKRQVESYEYTKYNNSFGLKDIEIMPTSKVTP